MSRGEKIAVILGAGLGILSLAALGFYAATAFVEMVNAPFIEEESKATR